MSASSIVTDYNGLSISGGKYLALLRLEGLDKFTERVDFEATGAQKAQFTRPLTSGTGLHGVNEHFEHRTTKKPARAGGLSKPANRL